MRIIERGILPGEKIYVQICRDCKTKFEFMQKEAKVVHDQRDGDFMQIECPVCHETCFTLPYKRSHYAFI
jgi:hypothetical protein